MPSVRKGEKQAHYVSRCVPYVMKHEKLDQKAALGKCYGMFRQHLKHKKSKGSVDCEPCWEEYLKEFDNPNYRIEIY
jgi:hypothetical protein